MKSIKVSVIVPNYNHGPHLAQRLESILNQTFEDFEILYLDDASTDDSGSIFEAFSDHPKIRAWSNTVNSGNPAVQWNTGVDLARGKYIWIAEADDFSDHRFLEMLVLQLDQHPDVGLAYCQSWETDANGHPNRTFAFHTEELDPERWNHDFINHGQDECRRFLSRKNTIPNASAVLFRRDLYRAVGGADESLRYCSDWLLWFHMLMRLDIAFVAEPLNYYRRHPGAFSNDQSLNIGRSAHAVYLKMLVAYPDVMMSFSDDHPRWPARHYYELGRHALREDRLDDARRLFSESVHTYPSTTTLFFWAASYLGKSVYRTLDNLMFRYPKLALLSQKLRRLRP